jgi:hypothetical protein
MAQGIGPEVKPQCHTHTKRMTFRKALKKGKEIELQLNKHEKAIEYKRL